MDPQPLTIPEWLVNMVGRDRILAEAQRVGDAAAIAALRDEVERLTPTTSKNGAKQPQEGSVH